MMSYNVRSETRRFSEDREPPYWISLILERFLNPLKDNQIQTNTDKTISDYINQCFKCLLLLGPRNLHSSNHRHKIIVYIRDR